MGAAFNSVSIEGDWSTVKAKFEALQEQDRHENGHSYSGGFGMVHGLTSARESFAIDEAADEWLVNNAQKYEAAIAVQVSEPSPHWRIGAWCSC